MSNNINFQYINIPVHLHNYSTNKCLHFTSQLFYTMLVLRRSGSLGFMQYCSIIVPRWRFHVDWNI